MEQMEQMEQITFRIQDIVKRLKDGQQQTEEPFTVGLEDKVCELVEDLISPSPDEVRCSRIFIVGMAGVGKTTLAMKLYHDRQVNDHFNARAWVTLPKEYDYDGDDKVVSDLQQNIDRQLNPGEGEQSAGKRYLIVLDNVWLTTVWNYIKTFQIPDGSTAKILITTRRIDLADEVSSAEHHHVRKLGLLGNEDSWKLFTSISNPDKVPLSPELGQQGIKIVSRCRGLPAAIIEMGRRLRRKSNIEEWSAVLEPGFEYRKGRPWHQALNSIKDDLPWDLKRCLFYFGLFSAKSGIPARRLITLWVAEEGLIPQRRYAKQLPEELAESYLSRLIDLDLVQVTKRNLSGEVKTCRLLEPVWEFWVSEAMKYDFLPSTDTSTASSKLSTDYFRRRIADHLKREDRSYNHIHGNGTNSYHHYPNLVSFLSFDPRRGIETGEEIGNFIRRCISNGGFLLLLVLDLENVFRPKLPKELCKLTRLRYLGLRWTYLEKLPRFIDRLLNLQTLDLKHTYISTLPSSIWKMRQLRHLYLSEAYRSRFARPTYWRRYYGRSLTQLQTLWGAFIDEKSPVNGGLNTLPNIRKLGLASRLMSSSQRGLMSKKLDNVARWIANLEQLESLRLKSYDEKGEPWDLHIEPFPSESKLSSIYLLGRLNNSRYSPDVLEQLFPKTLSEVTLSASQLRCDPMKMLGKLENLQILQLFHESYDEAEMNCSTGDFPKLQVLKLWKLEKLEKWYVDEGALPSLTDLEIRSCTSLAELPEELPPRLQVLKLCELKNLKKWHVKEGALPSLTDLEIRACTSLAELPEGLQHVTTLKELKLSGMPNEFMKKIKDKESRAWYKIKPRDHPEDNQIEGDMVLLPKLQHRSSEFISARDELGASTPGLFQRLRDGFKKG